MLLLLIRFVVYKLTLANLSVIALLATNISVKAQIISDPSLNTQVNLEITEQIIRGGKQYGSNLFHSFSQFSPTAEFTTRFDNNLDIQTIFSRVTGNIPSLIDGIIETNGTASLFLLNPAGIIFGENAQLTVGGSFIATTAESIIFADGTEFSSQLGINEALLTVSIPIGLQYGKEPEDIIANRQGNVPINLTVPSNKTLALLGGNVELNHSTIKASSGKLVLGSIAGSEEIEIALNQDSYDFTFEKVQNFGDIVINSNSTIDTNGEQGEIKIRGNNIFISQSSLENSPTSEKNSGLISLNANNLINLNLAILSTQVGGQDNPEENLEVNLSDNLITGNAGDILLSASAIVMNSGTVISASTLGQGRGGNITINADDLSISGFNATNFLPSVIASVTGSSADGGNININAQNIQLADGVRIDSSSFGMGKAGLININAEESIEIANSNPFISLFTSGVFAATGISGIPFAMQLPGRSGNINIKSPRLLLQQGGQISVSNFGTENAGNVFINVDKLQLETGSQIIAETASGKGGSIFINSNELILRDDSSISARADRNGNGGNLEIKSNNLVLLEDSLINADAKLGQGGNVTIYTEGLFTVVDPELVITASSELGVDGVVEIVSPNDNLRKETIQPISSSFSTDHLIVNYCNEIKDMAENKFVYINRGGFDTQPMSSIQDRDFLVDLGSSELIETNITETDRSHISINSQNFLKEASSINIDEKGNLELVATNSFDNISAGCTLN